MAVVQRRVCDIFGTSKDVKRIRVAGEILDDKGEPCGHCLTPTELDAGPRARKRLCGFVNKGTTKPNAGDAD